MQKLAILFIFIALFGLIQADNKLESSTLNKALKAALSEIILNGEYEVILNKHLGFGNYVVPNCHENGATAKWPTEKPLHSGSGKNARKIFYDLRDVLYRGQLRAAGAPTALFAGVDENFAQPISTQLTNGIEFDLLIAITRRISLHYDVLLQSLLVDVTAENQPGDSKFVALANALYTGFDFTDSGDYASVIGSGIPYEYDIVMAALSVQPVRQTVMKFVECPYFITFLTAIRTGLDPLELVNTIEDFNKPGVKVGVLSGTSGAQFVVTGVVPENVIIAYSEAEFIDIIRSNAVHVALAPNFQVQHYIETSQCDDCAPTGIDISTEEYSIATRWVDGRKSAAFGLSASILMIVAMAAVNLF